MFRYAAVLALSLVLAGCSSLPFLASPDPVRSLQESIDRVLADSLFVPSHASVKVVSLKTGETLYDRESKYLVRPASNMKLLTSSSALHYLGTDFTFRTQCYADTVLPDGTVPGNVYLKGFANPDLTTRDLDTLARRLADAGIRRIAGRVIGDAGFLDGDVWGTGWMWDDEPDPDAPYLSALSLNDNCIIVRVRSGLRAGDPLQVSTVPPTTYVTISNSGITVKDSVRNRVRVTRPPKDVTNVITVTGEMLPDTSRVREFKLTVWRPDLYAAHVFRERLLHAGIAVDGTADTGTVPAFLSPAAEHRQPIDSMVINLNKISDNLSADLTLKVIGAAIGGTPGTVAAGVSAVKRFLADFGIDSTKYLMADGSGLSHYNLVTAEQLNALVVGMYQRKDLFPLFYESLPVAGVDGTIRSRMRGTPAEGNLRAKTGSISGVSSLTGYVTTRDGEMLAFSMVMQNFILPTAGYRGAQDRIGALLAGFSRSGSLP